LPIEGAAPRVLVIDHHDSYTWNLVHLIAGVTGELPVVASHDEPIDFGRFTHLVLSPGPGRPDEPTDFALGGTVFALGLPVLGVCLGMQGLVASFGGTVERITPAHGEIATIAHEGTGLFAGLPDRFEAVRYHSLGAVRLPPELRRTAVDERSGVTMAVAHRELPLVGVQFHPESVLSQHGAALVRNFLAGSLDA
jgi:anthranilate synthase component II